MNSISTESDFEVKLVNLKLNAADRRFGFSIIGGCDELMSPEIEDISPGSAADKSDLQIGDEILAINGQLIKDFDHAKVIAHIHECIKERTITLKVKRTFKTNELSINENIKEAFIIGVDEQAKERLQSLTRANKVTPIDIQELAFQPIPVEQQKEQQQLPIEHSRKTSKDFDEYSITDTINMVKTETPKSSASKRIAPRVPLILQSPILLETSQQNSTKQQQQQLQNLLSFASSASSTSSKSTSTSSSSDGESTNSSITKPIVSKDHETSPTKMIHSTSSAISSNSSSLSSPHQHFFNVDDFSTREVPIDCPDTFVPTTKTKPTYPPNANTFTLTKNFTLATNTATVPTPSSPLSTFTKLKNSTQDENKKMANRQKQTQCDDVLRKIRDDQEIILRNSLRNSEKLRNLGAHIDNKENRLHSSTHTKTQTTAQYYTNDAFINDSPQKRNINDDIKRLNERYALKSSAHLEDTLEMNSFMQESHVDQVEVDFQMHENVLKVNTNPKSIKQQQQQQCQEQDVFELKSLYQSKEFQNALIKYNQIPSKNCVELVQEITRLIELAKKQNNKMSSPESSELLQLLSKVNVKNLIKTHDEVATSLLKDDDHVASPITHTPLVRPKEMAFSDESALLLAKAELYCVENLKLVNIDKPDAPLGATIKNHDTSIIIGRIVKGGAADMSGLLHEGDELLEINGIPMRGKTINEVCDMLADLKGTISFLIIPICSESKQVSAFEIVHVRALFNYEPEEDIYLPCKELGLSFLKGDILHVTSQEDSEWWQAYKDNDDNQTLAHLIPSQSFQEKRLAQMQALIGDSFMNRKHKGGLCVKAPNKNKRRKMLELNESLLSEELLTYEKVILYKPPLNRKRPIVLIGPHNIGRHELRKRLMQSNSSLYEVAVPHTTRLPRRDEVDGKDYHFLPRHVFEADIKQSRFIEHGEFEKNLYGTSTEAIKKVIENSKICVLNLYPQALKVLRRSDLMPYVIYIGPPSLAKLKELKTNSNESFKENDLLDIIDKGREIEELYGHYFDKIIRNSDMDKTYYELVETIDRVQQEENWIPEEWLNK